jgi:small-conductance mechanosensitive channel
VDNAVIFGTVNASRKNCQQAVGAFLGGRRPSRMTSKPEGTQVAETETGSAKLGQHALVTEIEKTRMELAQTIDAISDRVSPGKVAQRATARVRDRVSQVDPVVGGAIALAAVSLTSYLIWRRLRR